MIKYISGSIFHQKTQAIVNPVNCFGVVGKGLALNFKKKYPDNYLKYFAYCKEKNLRVGELFIFKLANNPKNPKYIINFATKNHWRDFSVLANIETGLINLMLKIIDMKIKSITIPALGCGLGGLSWIQVKTLIHIYYKELDCDVLVIPPHEY